MHAAAGTTALYVDCPLERSLRDLQTMERHITAQPLWLEDAGRVLLAIADNPLFMICADRQPAVVIPGPDLLL